MALKGWQPYEKAVETRGMTGVGVAEATRVPTDIPPPHPLA